MSDSLKDKVAGKAKEVKGKATGDKGTELEGQAQQTVGTVKGKADEVAGNVQHGATSAEQEAPRPAR
jgi:uncharacterized protein YjbJ (UPF0337 family)